MPYPADYDFTERLLLPSPQLDEDADGPLAFSKINEILDNAVLYDEGPIAQRPVAEPGDPYTVGVVYRSTDEGAPAPVYLSIGVGWIHLNPAGVVDGPVDVGTLRTLGTGEFQGLPGDHPTTINQRVPTDESVTAGKVHDSLKPSEGAGAGTEALRRLGYEPGYAAPGLHGDEHSPSGEDPLTFGEINLDVANEAAIPAPTGLNQNLFCFCRAEETLWFNPQGDEWVNINIGASASATASLIAHHMTLPTSWESVTSTSWAWMPTPDKFTLDVPADAYIFISYFNTIKQSVAGGGMAGLFIGATETLATVGGPAYLLPDPPNATRLQSVEGGLAHTAGAGVNDEWPAIPGFYSRMMQLQRLPAGTYDVGIKFKASSGNIQRRSGAMDALVISPNV